MLKAQLKSKIGVLGSEWRKIEDILTGDFFGALDYLPRQPFLRKFVERIATLNPNAAPLLCEDVDWDNVESRFWPMIKVEDEWVEPDLLLISNRWVLVVEVKLYTGLGQNQAWREYRAGWEIARQRGLPDNSVHYLLVSPNNIDLRSTLTTPDAPIEQQLLARASRLLWRQSADLIKSWRDKGPSGSPIGPDERRLLADLQEVLRRRGIIAFSGFKFTEQRAVFTHGIQIFCPDGFTGFLSKSEGRRVPSAEASQFLSRFSGILNSFPGTAAVGDEVFVGERFIGFLSTYRSLKAPDGPFSPGLGFTGFLDGCPLCSAASSLVLSGI